MLKATRTLREGHTEKLQRVLHTTVIICSNDLGDCSYSFQGSFEWIGISKLAFFFLADCRIFYDYSYMILIVLEFKCNDFEKTLTATDFRGEIWIILLNISPESFVKGSTVKGQQIKDHPHPQ